MFDDRKDFWQICKNQNKAKQSVRGKHFFHSAVDRLCLFQCVCSISLINFLVWINTASHLLISSIIIDHSDQPKSSISSTVDIWQECLSGNSTKCFFFFLEIGKRALTLFSKNIWIKKFKHFNTLHYFAFYCIKTFAVFLTLITGNLLNISPTKCLLLWKHSSPVRELLDCLKPFILGKIIGNVLRDWKSFTHTCTSHLRKKKSFTDGWTKWSFFRGHQ